MHDAVMLKNKNIICISSIDWDFVWQGHQEIMATFAKNGNTVLFIENTGVRTPRLKDATRIKKRIANWLKSTKGFRQEMENLYVYSPVVLPFPYSRLGRLINRQLLLKPLLRWMKAMDFHDPIIWTFLPTGTALDIINSIDHSILIYYCIADFYALSDKVTSLKKTEDELLKKCDLVFAQGQILYDKCKQRNAHVHIFPFGVNIDIFKKKPNASQSLPEDIAHIKKPIIGYIGGIHKHIDFGLLKALARTHPEWSLVLIGPLQSPTDELAGLPNVYLLGKKEFQELPRYAQEFDVCLIPYLKSNYTQTVYPTKLNEYHAMGKPVISTGLPEVLKFNKENGDLVFIGETHEEFIKQVSRALQEKDPKISSQRVLTAEKNSWRLRIKDMSTLMEKSLENKHTTSVNWRENFIIFYRRSRKRLAIICAILAVYLFIFYTPFVWFCARPLRIMQPPEKADCIVVFAGGVGESGEAMQGYEERVKYAVEMYKNGFAEHLIFSSGYSFYFKEPFIMKALAVSLGVPEQNILIENKASNTYKNVILTKDILEVNSWKKILLVSAPYHMKRCALVIQKNAPAFKVIFTPVPQSKFYAHGTWSIRKPLLRQLNLAQLKALMHEYMAIFVYKLNGWI